MGTTARQLEISPDAVAAYYDGCKDVLAFDALFLQSQIQWGTGTSKTCDVELDCTVMAKWRIQGFIINPSGVSLGFQRCPLPHASQAP